MNATRERELIDACLEGNPEAFGELVQPYQDRLFNTLYRLVGKREDAAELLQESLIRTYRGLRSYNGEAAFYTWLYRIAINCALTSRRRQRVRAVSTEELGEGTGFDLADTGADHRPTRNMENEERREIVHRALGEIGEPFRAVLILKDVEGLKYERIAEILDVPIGTVRSRLHRARRELRELLRPLHEQGLL